MSQMTDCVVNTLKTIATPNPRPFDSDSHNSFKRLRDDTLESNPVKYRRFIGQSSVSRNKSQASTLNSDLNIVNDSSQGRRSMVVSNIAPNISIEELNKFIAAKV